MNDKPFDAFERELHRVRESGLDEWDSLIHLVSSESLSCGSIFNFSSGFLQRPLADAIARPFIRRFSNRFVTAMVAELEQPSSNGIAITFDVAALSYLYHVTSEAATMNFPHRFPIMLAKGALRWLTRQPGFFYPQIQKQLNRNAMPWIVKTTSAFIHTARLRNQIQHDDAKALLLRYSSRDVLQFRALTAESPHPLAGRTIHECLSDPSASGYWAYLRRGFLRRVAEGSQWAIGHTMGDYRSSPFTLSDHVT